MENGLLGPLGSSPAVSGFAGQGGGHIAAGYQFVSRNVSAMPSISSSWLQSTVKAIPGWANQLETGVRSVASALKPLASRGLEVVELAASRFVDLSAPSAGQITAGSLNAGIPASGTGIYTSAGSGTSQLFSFIRSCQNKLWLQMARSPFASQFIDKTTMLGSVTTTAATAVCGMTPILVPFTGLLSSTLSRSIHYYRINNVNHEVSRTCQSAPSQRGGNVAEARAFELEEEARKYEELGNRRIISRSGVIKSIVWSLPALCIIPQVGVAAAAALVTTGLVTRFLCNRADSANNLALAKKLSTEAEQFSDLSASCHERHKRDLMQTRLHRENCELSEQLACVQEGFFDLRRHLLSQPRLSRDLQLALAKGKKKNSDQVSGSSQKSRRKIKKRRRQDIHDDFTIASKPGIFTKEAPLDHETLRKEQKNPTLRKTRKKPVFADHIEVKGEQKVVVQVQEPAHPDTSPSWFTKLFGRFFRSHG